MTIKRLLIFAPLVLIIILLQSYFWVPTYEQQTRGNPDRLTTYVTASTGDASLLNPILSADSASSEIASQVFEGLIDRELSVAEVVAEGHDRETVKKVEHLIYISEYKRFQSAPGTRLTERAFWLDRRYPIVNRWRDDTGN